MNENEKRETSLENESGESNDFGLKWGEETIKSDVSRYIYQDPSQSVEEKKKVEEQNASVESPVQNGESTSIEEAKTVVEELGTVSKPKEEVPISPIDGLSQNASISQIPENKVEKPETSRLEDSISSEEIQQVGGKKSSIGLVLLFVCLLLFVFFLPDIANYINLIKTRQEVQGSPTHTASPSPIVPTPSEVPTPSPKPVISLENIVDRFNRSQMVEEIKKEDAQIVLLATQKEGVMTIDYQVPVAPTSRSSTYQRKESILSSTNADITTATILVEVISQLQGNNEGIAKMIFEGDLTQYSLSENGISIEVNPNETLTLQIDLSKQLEISDGAIGVK